MGPVFAIFTEDSGSDAKVTIEALVRRLLPRIESLTQSQHVPPMLRPHGEAAEAVVRYNWAARTALGGALRRALVDDLATRLTAGEFVIFHSDGDTAWGGQSPREEQIVGLFTEVMRRMQRDSLPDRLLRFVPFYSIESWLYLNRPAVARLVARGKAPSHALDWLDPQASAEGGYDHVIQPKKDCPLHDRHNLTLAADGWPHKEAAKRSPSWRRVEVEWSAVDPLRAALRQTNPRASAVDR